MRPATREHERETFPDAAIEKRAALEARITRPFSDDEMSLFEPKDTARLPAPQLDGLVALSALRVPTRPPPAPTATPVRRNSLVPKIRAAAISRPARVPRALVVVAGIAFGLFLAGLALLMFAAR